MEIDFFNSRSLIVFICILQGVIFAGLLLFRRFKSGKKADFWLAVLLLVICSSLITPFIGFANVYDLNQWLTFFPFNIAYASGVCIWFYLQKERGKMKYTVITMFLSILILAIPAKSQTFFQKIAGNWEGTLEYLDYSENKRVKLKTYLTVTPSNNGNSAEILTVYDDFGRIIKDKETYKIDPGAKTYSAGDFQYKIDSFEDGKIVLLGSGQDGEKVEPIRETITFTKDSLEFLKETRTPWQFRNQMTFNRTNENILAKKTFSPLQLKEDFDIFKRTLKAIHPGIYRYQTKESLEKLFVEYEAKLKQPMSEGEFFKLISQLTNQIYCGHTFANPYNQDSLVRERLFNGKNYLPFYFQIIDGKIIVTENASNRDLTKGSEIKKINGVAAQTIIEKLLTVTKGDGKNTLDHRLQSIALTRFEAERYALFDWFFPLFFPLEDQEFKIEAIDFQTKKAVKFQVPAITKAERTAEMTKKYGPSPTYDDGWKFEIRENSTGYLKIDNSITWRLKTVKFKEFLANSFAELRAKNIRNLVIDLRGNGGGDTDVGFELARYLAKKDLPEYIKGKRYIRSVAPQKDLAKYLDTYSDELKFAIENGLPQASYKKAEGDYYEILPDENTTNHPQIKPFANNFPGKTFIIADSSNASATFQFLNYVRKNKLAAIFGQATGGNQQGINGGNYFFLRLPNSKVEIDIPVFFLAPLTPEKDESIVPDIPVKKDPKDVGENFDREFGTISKILQ